MKSKYIYRTVEITEAGETGKVELENPLEKNIKVVKIWGILDGTDVNGTLNLNPSRAPEVRSDIALTTTTFDGDVRKAIELDMTLEPKEYIEIKVTIVSGTFNKLKLVLQLEVQ